jgi:predicted Rossmann fold flavoprotein
VRIAVIGGGAAGVFGAIAAATRNQAAEIVIFEAAHQPLGKVRLSGGGRCNLTHHCFDPAALVRYYPRGSKELRGAFHRFQPRDTVAWFESHGVRLKTEEDGRMFPTTDKSATVVDCLLRAASGAGVQIRLDARVKSIETVDADGGSSLFEITSRGESTERFDRVLLATGSGPHGYRFAESLGHSLVPCVPSLFTFKVNDSRLGGLAGVNFDNVKLTMTLPCGKRLNQSGPLLVTHWGLSGPAVLKLSAWGARLLHDNNYRAELVISFLPNHSAEQLHEQLTAFREQHGRKRVHSENALPIPRKYWARVVHAAGIAPECTWTNVTKNATASIISELTRARFNVCGKGPFTEEFVTCGGVSLKEVDFKTMQSKLCPGLYLAGEILDIDGITGGFNLQSAWTTGWIAGRGMAD